MSDLVERLRARTAPVMVGAGLYEYEVNRRPDALCHEAADALAARDAEIAQIKALLEEAKRVVSDLVDQCEATEKELTEEHYHMHYSGESLPLCKARTLLAKLEAHRAD